MLAVEYLFRHVRFSMAADFEAFYDAATMGDRETVETMLATNPNLVGVSDASGFTALFGVAGQDEPDLAELLIDRGAEVSAKNDMGMTPLHIAQYASIVEVLVRRGADVNARAQDGWTPLHVQAQEGEDTGALEVMEALLQAGADPNLTDDDGNTPMTFALEREEPEKVRLLRAHGAKM
jgi:cytohesin